MAVTPGRLVKPATVALLIGGLAAATLATVLTMDRMGYTPCELCLVEREPFYGAIPLALATAVVAATGRLGWTIAAFGALAALFLVSAGLGVFHAGVEWQVWAGPSGCSGAMAPAAGVDDFLKQLQTVKVVRCDAAAMRVLGLSLAGWNAVLSAGLATLALVGLRAAQSGSTVTASPGRTVPPSRTAA